MRGKKVIYIKNSYKLILILGLLLFSQCKWQQEDGKNLTDTILTDTSSFFYIDVKNYPVNNKSLPIGIFDSGTGGLTVMDVIVNYDGFNNETFMNQPDGILDFKNEYFIYHGDQANMPYGLYPSLNKSDLLVEHIIKDVQFLLGDKYYTSAGESSYMKDKSPVKAIVIACNTATAYGKVEIEEFLTKAGLDIKVIGVIDAGVNGAFEQISKDENLSIGVMATEGTVLSNGYLNTIKRFIEENKFSGEIEVYQQAGFGLAGAIDGVIDYIKPSATAVREDYKGPSITSEQAKIDVNIINRYNFDWNNNKILYSGEKNNPSQIQLNSIENYISYNLVSLLEQLKNTKNAKPLKTIILGCTHYPFYENIFTIKLKELYNLQENGEYVYRNVMYEEIILVDPAVNTAKELYELLIEKNLFNSMSVEKSEFYISVPNVLNENTQLDTGGNFTYEYKYGREAGKLQEYVKRVPFCNSTLHPDVVEMLRDKTPMIYKLISNFNEQNEKTNYLIDENRLSYNPAL